jgi:hypothetical protein
MKRRTFLLVSAGAGAALAAPFIYSNYRAMKWSNQTLIHPGALSQFCDIKHIRQIGLAYRSMVPAENSEQRLLSLLLPNKMATNLSLETSADIRELEGRIREEFKEGKIISVNGWVISVTEARQCALLSFS